tara:strand:- start:6763 stop:7731 length:969 start_codon:yes stop_codon:yes gene_type:complete
MKICITGADGYIGWPLYQHLIKKHDVLAIDNLWKRYVPSYTQIDTVQKRFSNFKKIDVTEFNDIKQIINDFKPEVVIHLAQQRSAPYSMGNYNERKFTVENNTIGTLNILECIKHTNVHLIHIGSMGVYGYDNEHCLEEGDSVTDPGSLYHITKCFDQHLFKFYNKNYGCEITDLHQGIVWGISEGNRLDYDGDHGTVVNRFLIQRANKMPLTIYGDGTQKRAFIHLKDSIECINKFLPSNGYRIINQFTEIYTLNDVANMIDKNQEYVSNPRLEKLNNNLEAKNKTIKSFLNPIKLSSDSLNIHLPQKSNLNMSTNKKWKN